MLQRQFVGSKFFYATNATTFPSRRGGEERGEKGGLRDGGGGGKGVRRAAGWAAAAEVDDSTTFWTFGGQNRRQYNVFGLSGPKTLYCRALKKVSRRTRVGRPKPKLTTVERFGLFGGES